MSLCLVVLGLGANEGCFGELGGFWGVGWILGSWVDFGELSEFWGVGWILGSWVDFGELGGFWGVG